jgi:hypothetical protein
VSCSAPALSCLGQCRRKNALGGSPFTGLFEIARRVGLGVHFLHRAEHDAVPIPAEKPREPSQADSGPKNQGRSPAKVGRFVDFELMSEKYAPGQGFKPPRRARDARALA